MFAPRLRGAIRPIYRQTTQCLRQQRQQPIPRNFLSSQLRQQRYASNRSFARSAKKLLRDNPISFPVALAAIVVGIGFLAYANYFYYSYIIGAFHKYPEPVAKELRKALYYTNMSLDAKKASKYYMKALRVAQEVGMDPFSDEVVGIRIQVAALMEKVSQFNKAIFILENVKTEMLKWIDAKGVVEGNEGTRTRLLAKTVAISVKLGELYSGEYVGENEKAEENLVWAVETALKEIQRREKEGVKADEGEWLSSESLGASMEALGHIYEAKNQHDLAAPLFLQAISLSSTSSCHMVVLMNNLAISISQQNPPSHPGQAPISRPALVTNAKAWAQKALNIAANIKPPERTEECDLGCAVAIHNLGEFAEMEGDIREARRRYEEAKGLAKAIGFQEGLMNSEDAIRRLAEK